MHANLLLRRTGDPDAAAAMVSLPLPRGAAGRIRPAFTPAGMHPLAWWRRPSEPRRMLTVLAAAAGGRLPSVLGFEPGIPNAPDEPAPWTLTTPLTTERIPYVPHAFKDIDGLRGIPAADCTTLEYALDLTFGGRTLRLQPGATGPGTAECLWQNVLIDRLWRNPAAEAVRVGGVIYNEDTYLWADLYLLLFANGVASATLHFTNTKLHIKGYDFRGLPYLKIAGDGITGTDADLPGNGWRQDTGVAAFNFSDTAVLCSDNAPATLRFRDDAAYYMPFARVANPRKPDAPGDLWEPGFARSVRFQFSLSDAAPAVARYGVPAWWYGICGEPWPGGGLPVRGRFTPVAEAAAERVRAAMTRGGFDGGSLAAAGGAGNDGGAGAGLMQQAYLTGDPDAYRDALDYCIYWADQAVDHTDYTVHQWLGGWGWKTCAYNKFRDVIFGWLETGDPWMVDTAELTAEAYYAWFRSNWPRNTIGRDAFDVGGWVLLWRYLHSEHAGDRMREMTRMIRCVVEARGSAGGQMGAGPHPGWHASLYMTGVSLMSLVEAMEAEAEVEADMDMAAEAERATLERLHTHFIRDDVELFPSSLGKSSRATWGERDDAVWSVFAMHIYAALGRRFGFDQHFIKTGFEKLAPSLRITDWGGRPGDNHLHPRIHDALMLEARLADDGDGVVLAPAFGPHTLPWPDRQVVATPWGDLTIAANRSDTGTQLTFSAPAKFRIRIRTATQPLEAGSQDSIRLEQENGRRLMAQPAPDRGNRVAGRPHQ